MSYDTIVNGVSLRILKDNILKNGYSPSNGTVLDLIDKVASLEADAARMTWIQNNILCADFEYYQGEKFVTALCIEWPERAGISANLRASIDAAMQAKS